MFSKYRSCWLRRVAQLGMSKLPEVRARTRAGLCIPVPTFGEFVDLLWGGAELGALRAVECWAALGQDNGNAVDCDVGRCVMSFCGVLATFYVVMFLLVR